MRKRDLNQTLERLMGTDAVEQLQSITSMELLVLKLHALLEATLWNLLGARLGVREDQLPVLTFDTLCRLALASDEDRAQREQALTLNRIRNGVAHRFDPSGPLEELPRFAFAGRRTTVRWPTDHRNELVIHATDNSGCVWPTTLHEQLVQVRWSGELLMTEIYYFAAAIDKRNPEDTHEFVVIREDLSSPAK